MKQSSLLKTCLFQRKSLESDGFILQTIIKETGRRTYVYFHKNGKKFYIILDLNKGYLRFVSNKRTVAYIV